MNNHSDQSPTTESPPDTFFDDLIVVTIWSIILIYAFITNTLTLLGIFRSPKMRRATSYWIVASLAICDWFMIIISLAHIIPATFLHESYVEVFSKQTIGSMFVYNVFWYSGVIQLAAMAVNRFVSIVFPLQYKSIFAPRNTLIILIVLYILGLLASVPALHECCYTVYDHNIYVTYYIPEDSQYMWLDIMLNTLSVTTMIICYAAILIKVRNSTIRRRRYQLAAKAGTASGAVLLIAAAAAATSRTATTTTPLLADNPEGDGDKNKLGVNWGILKKRLSTASIFQVRKQSSMIVINPDCNGQISQSKSINSGQISPSKSTNSGYNGQSLISQSKSINSGYSSHALIDQQKSISIDHSSHTLNTPALITPSKSITADSSNHASIDQHCPSHAFIGSKSDTNFDHSISSSISDRRRSITSPNLFAATCDTLVQISNNNKSVTTTLAPPDHTDQPDQQPSTAMISYQNSLSALAALQRQPDQTQQATRREIRLFVQFFVVSLVFLSTWVTWQWLPRIPNASKWVYFATTTFFFINNAVNPTVYLIYNSGLRNEIKEILICHLCNRFNRGQGKHGKVKLDNMSTTGGRPAGMGAGANTRNYSSSSE